jgi:alpha/beta superfamily hydrolase
MTFDVTGPAGRLEARLDLNTESPVAIAVIAPEHGGSMQSRVLHNVTLGLLRLDCAVVRFNYRGTGTSDGEPTTGDGELEDYLAVLKAANARFPTTPLWTVGYSFGSYLALGVGARTRSVALMLGIGLLVEDYDYDLVGEAAKPTFIIHGEADERCALNAVRRFYATLSEPRELIVIDGADHAFDGHASELADAVEDLLAGFEPDSGLPQD